MSKEMRFYMYLVEHYAEYKNSTSGDILTLWDEIGISKKIFDMYELYHSEAIENAFADIDRMVSNNG